jgi:hypothetical protein
MVGYLALAVPLADSQDDNLFNASADVTADATEARNVPNFKFTDAKEWIASAWALPEGVSPP